MESPPIHFPVICFCSKLLIAMVQSERVLASANAKALSVYFPGMFIVDRDLNGYFVEEAKPDGYRQPFWGFRLSPIPHRLFRLRLTFRKSPGHLSLTDLKTRLCEVFDDRNDEVWVSSGNVADFRKEVQGFSSVQELFEWPFWRFNSVSGGWCL